MGYNVDAYLKRETGHSPGEIRSAVWNMVKDDITGTVIDAGAGGGDWSKHLLSESKATRVIAVDHVDYGAGQIPGLEFHLVDLSSESLPDVRADWLFAIELLEHLANPRHFFSQAAKCLKPGGRFVITTPCNDSLRARLSLLFRGYFPAFCDHDYVGSGHITPILRLDVSRMAAEAQFSKTDFHFPLPGQVPCTQLQWQDMFGSLRGQLFTDTLVAILTR